MTPSTNTLDTPAHETDTAVPTRGDSRMCRGADTSLQAELQQARHWAEDQQEALGRLSSDVLARGDELVHAASRRVRASPLMALTLAAVLGATLMVGLLGWRRVGSGRP